MVRAGRWAIILRGVALGSLSVALRFFRRSSVIAAAISLCLAALPVIAHGANRGLFHATLLRSTPAANSHLSKPPASIRLVFSEEIVPTLSQITLVSADGTAFGLNVASDPHDVRTLVGSVGTIPLDRYKVLWRVLSADGHPVEGTFAFSIEPAHSGSGLGLPTASSTETSTSTPGSAAPDSTRAEISRTSEDAKKIPVLASVLRGVGLGALMAGLGVLFFGVTAGERRVLTPRKHVVRFIALGALLLAGHFIAWMYNVLPSGSINRSFSRAVLESTPGRIEVARVTFALLALGAITLLKSDATALVLGGACLVLSGAVGHPAAMHPYWTIPAKMVHLLAGSLWLGGLLWLVSISRQGGTVFAIEAKRVSSAALWGVVAIFFSGTVQTRFFINSPGDLIHSGYGRLVVVKFIGLVALVMFGAYNRFGVLPHIDNSHARPKLARSVRQEIVIVIVLIVIGGFLAYVPTPPPPRPQLSSSQDAHNETIFR